MEVWQRMKLSFTNSSFGLILSLVNVHLLKSASCAFEKIGLFGAHARSPFGLRSARAPHKRRRPLGLASLTLGTHVPCETNQKTIN